MRLATLGCGSVGRRHIRNLKVLGVEHLVAFDVSSPVCRAVAQETGAAAVSTLDEVWEFGPDAAIVACPTNLHVELALAAARHNCHLFIEKPLSYSLEGLDELNAEARRRRLVTMVGCNMRFHPGPAKVKELIDRRAVGQVIAARVQTGSYLPKWRPWQDYRQSYSASPRWGGAILDCIHEIDLALWYFGGAEVVAAAHLPASPIALETDGLAEILLRHRSGVLCSVHVNFVQRDYRRCCQVIGSEGTIYWDLGQHRVDLYGPEGDVTQSFSEPERFDTNAMYVAEMRHFLDAVEGRVDSVNPLEAGRAAVEVALAARRTNSRTTP